MKYKVFRCSLVLTGAIAVIMLCIGFNYHHRIASDYKKVLRRINVELPRVTDVESWDNYDRGASRWDCLEHIIKFEECLSTRTISKLERLCVVDKHWTKHHDGDKTIYVYQSEPVWKSDLYFMSCRICEDNARIEYYIDEDEGIFCILVIFVMICITIVGLIIWGVAKIMAKVFENICNTE